MGAEILDRKKARDFWRKGDVKVIASASFFQNSKVRETGLKIAIKDGTFEARSE